MALSKPLSGTFLLLVAGLGWLQAAERPTLNHYDPRDPRPDILPHPFYYAHTEYRRAYNRPRDISGWIADKIAPTSQEAMVWAENVHAGNYDRKHMPPMYKRYCYPKPWEVLQTGPRPDFPSANRTNAADMIQLGTVGSRPSLPEAAAPGPSGQAEVLNVAPDAEAEGGLRLQPTPPVPVPRNAP